MQAVKLLAVAILSAAVALFIAAAPVRVCFSNAESYVFFCGTSSADCREERAQSNFSLVKAALKNVCGEEAVYSAKNFNLNEFLAEHDAEVLFTEELSDSVNYYCSADLPYEITLYGRRVNLHVCVKQDAVLAASPIIFGGY